MKNDTFFTVPFPRNTYFVGREAELDALHNALTANGQGQVGINPAGLTGMGGIGKTQLAVEYCYRALAAAHFPDGIFWLNAAFPLREEFSKLGQKLIGLDGLLLPQMQMRKLLVKYFNISELQDLCLELGVNHEEIAGHNDTISSFARGLIQFCQQRNRLPELLNHCFQNRPKVMWPKPWEDEPEQTRSQDDWIGAAFDYLQAHPNSLLVLDNLPDPLTLTQSLGREWVPANLPGALMFTTRSGELYHFTPVPLKVLPEDAALKLLLRHPARQSFQQAEYPEHETAREICQMVGYLPLALEVAGAQLGARPALKLAAYRRTLHKQGALPVIENKRLPVQTAHETGLQAVLMEQWAQLPSDEARLLLRVAAAFEEAAQLPAARLGLMAGLPDEAEDFFEDITLAETLRQLVAASLLELLDKQVMQASDDNEAIEYQDMRLMIRLHPLVREFTMQQPPFSGPLPGVDTKEIGLFCARNLIDAYENFAVLERHAAERGVYALQDDLLAALEFLPVFKSNTNDHTEMVRRVDDLLSILRLEMHNLKDWDRVLHPMVFAQQLLYRISDLGIKRLLLAATNLLTNRHSKLVGSSTPYFIPLWSARNESSALIKTLVHKGINSVMTLPDGDRVLSLGYGTLKLWNLKTGVEELTLKGYSPKNSSLAVTPDGDRVVMLASSSTLKVWNLKTGVEEHSLKTGVEDEHTLEGRRKKIESLLITPDGKRFVSLAPKEWKVWNLRSGLVEHTVKRRFRYIDSITITPDGRRVVEHLNYKIIVWNLETKVEEYTIESQHLIGSIRITPDGESVIAWTYKYDKNNSTGKELKALKVWNIKTGVEEQSLLRTYPIYSVEITPDGARAILRVSDDKTLKVWNIKTGVEEQSLLCPYPIKLVGITPDGNRVIIKSGDRTIKIKVWNIKTGVEEQTVLLPDYLDSVVVTSDGDRLILALGKMLKVWNIRMGVEEQTLVGHSHDINSVRIALDGKRVITGSRDGTLKVWNLGKGLEEYKLAGHSKAVRSVVFTPDGGRVLSAGDDKIIKEWNLRTGVEEHILGSHSKDVLSIVITPDGKQALSAADDNTVKVWNLRTGLEEQTLSGGSVRTLAFTPDGERTVYVLEYNKLMVWNQRNKVVEHWLLGHQARVRAVALTPDGERAVSASDDCRLIVWNVITGAKDQILVGHSGDVNAVAVTPDGKRVVSASDDKTLKVWNLSTGELEQTLEGHTDIVMSIAATSNGDRVISVSLDRMVKVWDLNNGKEIGNISLNGFLYCMSLSADDSTIVVGDSVGSIYCLRLID